MSVLGIVGTVKGGFLLRAGDDRKDWTIEGPIFKGWKVTAAMRDRDGRWFVATASDVYGAALHSGTDLKNLKQIENAPAYPKEGDRKLTQTWTLFEASDALYAGVDQAGLFRSTDHGESWSPVEGLNDHATRPAWFPGAGGLCAHAILQDPKNPKRLWVGISAVGVFRTDDGGLTWHPKNNGVKIVIEDEKHKDIGFCVHGLAQDPDNADVIYRREHSGMFRSKDGGENWERTENGLSSWFGFPIAIDRKTKTLYAIPLESDEYRVPPEGKLTVCRSRNGGDLWEPLTRGLPREHNYTSVLRGAMDVDERDPCGVYFGTAAGSLHVSADAGNSWTTLPWTLPRVLCVEVFDDV